MEIAIDTYSRRDAKMARRLPIYVLLDNSLQTDMRAVQRIDEFLTAMFKALPDNPYLLEIGYVSVIKLGGKPKVILPLTSVLELSVFQTQPSYRLEGARNVGAGIELLVRRIKAEVQMRTGRDSATGKVIWYEGVPRADFSPMVILLVGGNPDDDINTGVLALRTIGLVDIRVCGCSSNCDLGVYEELTREVYDESHTTREQFYVFCKYLGDPIDKTVRIDEL